MAKYNETPVLTAQFQKQFTELLISAPNRLASEMLENAANILKNKGTEAQNFVLEVNAHLLERSVESGSKISPVIIKALKFATEAHNYQIRKHPNLVIPYIVHIYDVARRLLRLEITDEITLCAAILHDTVEDTECSLLDILVLFGEDVRAIVDQVSEGDYPPGVPKPSKWERKLAYIAKVENAPPSLSNKIVIVSAIDKLSNGYDYIHAAYEGNNLDEESRLLQSNFYGRLVPIYLKHLKKNQPELHRQIDVMRNELHKIW